VRTAGRAGLRALLAADWRMTGAVVKIVRRMWIVGLTASTVIGRRRGRSQHYCGSLDCGLALMAFWQKKANAKC